MFVNAPSKLTLPARGRGTFLVTGFTPRMDGHPAVTASVSQRVLLAECRCAWLCSRSCELALLRQLQAGPAPAGSPRPRPRPRPTHLMGSWSSLSSLLCAILMPLFLALGQPERLRRQVTSEAVLHLYPRAPFTVDGALTQFPPESGASWRDDKVLGEGPFGLRSPLGLPPGLQTLQIPQKGTQSLVGGTGPCGVWSPRRGGTDL